MSNVCYSPLRGIDDVLSSKLGGGFFTPYRVATLRGMYEEQSKKPLDLDNLDEAAKALAAFRNKLAKGAAQTPKNFGTILARSYRQLTSAFTSEERFNRLNMITRAFSAVIDGYQAKNPSLSREAIVKGWHVNGELRLGENHIFEMVYNGFRGMRAKAVQEGNQEVADKITQVLNNWSALTTYARRMLKETEGVKLGNNVDYADLASETNYDGDNLAESFDASEEKREGWQEQSDRRSAFGSLGKQVRKLIGSLPLFETKDGQLVPVMDDLGQPVLMDPVRVHQSLMETLRGITSEAQMIGAFNYVDPTTGKPTAELKHPWMKPIVDALRKNPQLRTQFFVDFKKNFQPYSILQEDEKRSNNGVKYYISKVLNKVENLLEGPFNTRVNMGVAVSAMSMYDSKGNIDWQKLQKARSLINEWLVEQKEELPGVFGEAKQYKTNPSKFYTRGVSRIQQRNFLRQASEALGIEVDADTINAIMSRPASLREYTKNLLQAVTFGIEGNLTEAEKKALDSGNYSALRTRKYRSLLNAKQKQSDRVGTLREKVNKMLSVISTAREGERYESRARHYDRNGNGVTLFSNVYPSYLGDKLEQIQSYVKVNDKPGLKRFIEREFLNSSLFRDANGEVLNKWLEELIKCCNTPNSVKLADTFASQFTYERFLGSNTNSFENFTGKQHAISLLQFYFADKQQNKNKGTTALYPVFILGDSGVQKFVRARRYASNEFQELLDGYVNVYRQERRRAALAAATLESLYDKGHVTIEGKEGNYKVKGIDNFTDKVIVRKENGEFVFKPNFSYFTTLQFLNKDFKASDGTVGKYASMLSENPSRSQVEAAIKAYMSDAVAEFKQRLTALGVLETREVVEGTEKVQRYIHLNQEATPQNIDKVLADYYWNTKFATIQQLQLMTIDPSFYKGTKDLQKRYKEIHAPGTVLSLSARDFNGNLYSEDGIERCVYFDDIDINAEISNPEFMKAIEAHFGKDSRYQSYLANTLTDGQGYRTLKSYRKVMGMAGLWTREMQNVYDEIENIKAKYGKGEIPMEELTKIANMAVVFQPIKPYMFTHEVYPVNDTDQLLIPVQHKYAEAVLIPELLPAGSKLRDMAYWMDEHVDSNGKPAPIDLIGSTKIVKVGGFGSTDISQASTAETLNEALSKAYVHQLGYSDYRIQTNVPEHINSSQLFGTQVRKLIMANIGMNSDYSRYVGGQRVNLGGIHGTVNLNGRNLVSFYNSLIVANILESFNKFNNNISNPEKLSEMLIQATINNSRESMDNIFAYATEDGKFAMPLFEGALEHDSAALMFSTFKKLVNKQAIKGGSAVQVSAMGITGYAEDGDLKYVTDGSNNILYAECEIPWDISYTDENGNEVALKFEDYCNPDGTLKMGPDGTTSLLETQFPGATSFLAYRIPTERDYSMINLRVKRFSQKTAGGTIKVPAQGTTIAGFDFDVDKLYFMRREFKAKKKKQSTDEASDNLLSAIFGQDTSALIEFEEYDFTKSLEKNDRAARNNMLIELIQQRLMDEETFSQRYTPGGFANASRSARVMRELLFGNLTGIVSNGTVDFAAVNERAKDKKSDPEPNYDPSDPMTIITYNQQNQVAGKLIGIFANQNTHHAFCSLMREFRLNAPISFAGHSYGDGRISDFLHAPEGVDVDLNVAEFLSASVDAVKDPVLNFMNLNTITADAGAVLARIGYTTTEIGMLLNQPIIREVCDYCFNNTVGVDRGISAIKYKYENAGGQWSQSVPVGPSVEELAMNIVNERRAREAGDNEYVAQNATEQLSILRLFNEISTIASEVSQFVMSTKFTASNAVGSTFGDMYAQQMRVARYIDKVNSKKSSITMKVTDRAELPINMDYRLTTMSDSDYMDTLIDTPFAYEQAMFDANRKALAALNKYYPYEKECYRVARGMMAGLTKGKVLDAATINSIHNDMMVYLMSQQELSDFNGNLPKNDTGHGPMTVREYYTNWFAKDLFNELEANPSLKAMPIFKYMTFPTVENQDGTEDMSIDIQGIGGLAPHQKDELKESWAELARVNPLIARDLFLYNFHKLGFTFSPKSFMNLAPVEVKQAISMPSAENPSRTYVGFLNEVMADRFRLPALGNDFAIQYILNHLDNKKFVFDAKGKDVRDVLKPLVYERGDEASSRFTLELTNIGDPKIEGQFVIEKDKDSAYFIPAIMIDGMVYIANGTGAVFNEGNTPTSIEYVRMDRLGAKGKSLQYNSYMGNTTPTMEIEDSFVEGNSSQEVEPVVPVEFNREEAISQIAGEMIAAAKKAGLLAEEESGSGIVEMLKGQKDEDLQDTITAIREACRKDGIIMLDAEGNMLKGC